MSNTVLFEGTKIKMGGKELILPTMGGKAYRTGGAFEKLKIIEDAMEIQRSTGKLAMTGEIAGSMYELTHMALQRNYPEITFDEVEDGLGLDEIMECFPLLVSQDPEKAKAGLAEMAKNAQKQSTKKAK